VAQRVSATGRPSWSRRELSELLLKRKKKKRAFRGRHLTGGRALCPQEYPRVVRDSVLGGDRCVHPPVQDRPPACDLAIGALCDWEGCCCAWLLLLTTATTCYMCTAAKHWQAHGDSPATSSADRAST
jgi:hypothetical protein